MNKAKIYTIIGRLLFLLIVAGMFVLMVSGVRVKQNKKCTALDIRIGRTEQKGFVNKKEVSAIIENELNGKPVGTSIKAFDLRKTEKALEQNVWIRKAQLFFDNNCVLHVQVAQRVPVLRLIDNSGASYYMDSTGFTLPLSMNDRADVPVFTGIPVNRNASTQKAVLAIAAAINSDSFWLAQAAQINWIPGNRFEIYPAFGDHVIEFGNADNATNKLMRLKLFYEQVSVRKGFDAYPKISVAYSRQVLAIKPDSGKTTIDAQKALQVFDQMVKSNRLTATVDKDDDHDPAPAVATATVDKSGSVDDHPPDEKNQEEKTTAASKQPKAVMPKRNSN